MMPKTDLRETPVHITPLKQNSNIHTGSVDADGLVFECFRCHRAMPDAQFGLTGINEKRRLMYRHPFCHTCRKQQQSSFSTHDLYTPDLHRYLSHLINSSRSGAKKRYLVFAISDEDLLELYCKQSGLCAVTGLPMTYSSDKKTFGKKNQTHVSVDRIRSERNYTIDNIHLVCRAINQMKWQYTMDEFRYWCAQVVLGQNDEAVDYDESEGYEKPS